MRVLIGCPRSIVSARPRRRDKLSISRTGQDYQIAKQAVKDAPDIREDKVSDLKSRIESGSYEVSAKDFATHLMEQYNAVWGA